MLALRLRPESLIKIKDTLVKIKSFDRLINDDGTNLHPATEAIAFELFYRIKNSYPLGPSSPITDKASLRLVSTVMNNFKLRRKKK